MPLKFANNQSLTATTSLPSAVPTDNLILISTQTASNSANISFTGINGTYDMYEFKFIDIHPRTNSANLTLNFSTDSGSNYNVTKTTTWFRAGHSEADADAFGYSTFFDLAQSTADQVFIYQIGSGSDENACGSLQLFNPSSTTYVKHFISRCQSYLQPNSYSLDCFVAGYANTTSAINAIQFKMDSGNFDGIIKMYGVKKS
jgi:hypothetical protein